MSYSSLCIVFNKSARAVKEYSNAYGTRVAVLDYISSRYDLRDDIFELIRNNNIDRDIRACLILCLDFGVIVEDDRERIGTLIMEAGQKISAAFPNYANNFPQIGRDIMETRVPKNATGLGLNVSSVLDTWLDSRRLQSVRPFNIGRYFSRVVDGEKS